MDSLQDFSIVIVHANIVLVLTKKNRAIYLEKACLKHFALMYMLSVWISNINYIEKCFSLVVATKFQVLSELFGKIEKQ